MARRQSNTVVFVFGDSEVLREPEFEEEMFGVGRRRMRQGTGMELAPKTIRGQHTIGSSGDEISSLRVLSAIARF
jgi:hypothetical protein